MKLFNRLFRFSMCKYSPVSRPDPRSQVDIDRALMREFERRVSVGMALGAQGRRLLRAARANGYKSRLENRQAI